MTTRAAALELVLAEPVSAYRGPSLHAPQFGTFPAGTVIGVIVAVVKTDVFWFVCTDPTLGRYFVPVLDERVLRPARLGDARPEFTRYVIDNERLEENGDIFRTGHCPGGYTAIDADQDQAYATPTLLRAAREWEDRSFQYYMRCMRTDVYERPETSQDEPPVHTQYRAWWDELLSKLGEYGKYATPLLIGGAVVLGVLVLRR